MNKLLIHAVLGMSGREMDVVLKGNVRDPCGTGTVQYLDYGCGHANLHL